MKIQIIAVTIVTLISVEVCTVLIRNHIKPASNRNPYGMTDYRYTPPYPVTSYSSDKQGTHQPQPGIVECEKLFKGKKYEAAIKKGTQILAAKEAIIYRSDKLQLGEILAQSYEKTGNIPAAVKYYRWAIIGPQYDASPTILCHYGDLCSAIGQMREAKRAYIAVRGQSNGNPPNWPNMDFYNLLDHGPSGNPAAMSMELHPSSNLLTPLAAPQLSSPSFREARAVAYYIAGRQSQGNTGYPYDIAHMRVAAQLMPSNPIILWGYAHMLHYYGQDRTAFLEYNLAEKYAQGDVREAIRDLRRKDNLEKVEWVGASEGIKIDNITKKVTHIVEKSHPVTVSASHFRNSTMAPYNLNTALGLSSKLDKNSARSK